MLNVRMWLTAGVLTMTAACGASEAAPGGLEWKHGAVPVAVRYAVPDECPETDGPPECRSWWIHAFSGKKETLVTDYNETRDADGGYTYRIRVTDAAVWVPTKGGASVMPGFRLSADGHRLAYFSVARQRFVAHDLPSGAVRELSPEIDTANLRSDAIAVSADGAAFAVSDGEQVLVTEFDSGKVTTLPLVDGVIGITPDIVFASKDDTVVGVVRSSGARMSTVEVPSTARLSPDGRWLALVGDEPADTIELVAPATGRRREPLRPNPLREPTVSSAETWLSRDKLLIRTFTADTQEFVGFFSLDLTTGRTARVKRLPLAPEAVAFGAVS
ncbi:hypothetical protein [Nonomuraea sp. NPDC003804]|uniref:hypothetical protein n=1 Tax=Nonomuraea sp. NPDC003804 TaxID=3154547 RepID=UPI0033B154F2